MGLNHPPVTADHHTEQPPEVDAKTAGAGQPAGDDANDARGGAADEAETAGWWEQTPGAGTLDTAAR